HLRICVLLDNERRGGVRTEQRQKPRGNILLIHPAAHRRRDLEQASVIRRQFEAMQSLAHHFAATGCIRCWAASCWRAHIAAYFPPRASSSPCRPRSTTRPSSSTMISSAWITVERRWAITRVVRSAETSCRLF